MALIMKKFLLCVYVISRAILAQSQSQPIVAVDNITVTHEERGWRVTNASASPIQFNLIKGDLIVRIDGKNASEAGPMVMASLFNEGNRQVIHLFIERGDLRMWTTLRDIRTADLDPVGPNPFRRVASGFRIPDADFTNVDGHEMTLEHFKGKWLLIDYIATWCEPCMAKLPQVLSLADQNHLNLLLVAIHDKPEAVRRMQQKYKINSPIAVTGTMAHLPIDFGITTNVWTGQIPSLVLVGPDGEVALIDVGAIDADHVGKAIDSLVSENADEDSK
jgi:thiol-disulfide isomerase/thioredoxin